MVVLSEPTVTCYWCDYDGKGHYLIDLYFLTQDNVDEKIVESLFDVDRFNREKFLSYNVFSI